MGALLGEDDRNPLIDGPGIYIRTYMTRLSSRLGTRLRALLAMLDGDVEALYARLGTPFRPRFYPVVSHLLAAGSATVGELAGAAGVSQPAITQTLSEMEKLGLIDVSVADDRRVRSVALSQAGAATAGELAPMWLAIDDAADELDRELPYALSAILDAASDALRKERFLDRIDRHTRGD
ncbi:MarR family winged helix-turn-helix transcriptional regulator [Erythrobacter donghaensis]|uniref:MarR family winged helix-turn-helix transcriptional regulator n=2 Tax=Erythrobacter donghaensis TaxID=267135 RepID=UPI0018C70FA9|nr:MarR family transcriptional regulator [Erythrobacter donghaensis]